MAKGRSVLVAVLLLMWTGAPALRCLLPNESLTPEEQACCKSMGGNCGDMDNHPCCRKVQTAPQAAVVVKNVSAPDLLVLATLPFSPANIAVPRLLRTTDIEIAASPPLPAVSNAVLRI